MVGTGVHFSFCSSLILIFFVEKWIIYDVVYLIHLYASMMIKHWRDQAIDIYHLHYYSQLPMSGDLLNKKGLKIHLSDEQLAELEDEELFLYFYNVLLY